MDGQIWDQASHEVKDLIARILCKQDIRISAAEAFMHPWFDKIRQIEEADDTSAVHQRG